MPVKSSEGQGKPQIPSPLSDNADKSLAALFEKRKEFPELSPLENSIRIEDTDALRTHLKNGWKPINSQLKETWNSLLDVFRYEFGQNGAKGSFKATYCRDGQKIELSFSTAMACFNLNQYGLHELKVYARIGNKTAKFLNENPETWIFKIGLVPPKKDSHAADLLVSSMLDSQDATLQCPAEYYDCLIRGVKRQLSEVQAKKPHGLSEALSKFNVSELIEGEGNMELLPP
jgi:hypothetical protein